MSIKYSFFNNCTIVIYLRINATTVISWMRSEINVIQCHGGPTDTLWNGSVGWHYLN